jgi:hypothetical protein
VSTFFFKRGLLESVLGACFRLSAQISGWVEDGLSYVQDDFHSRRLGGSIESDDPVVKGEARSY